MAYIKRRGTYMASLHDTAYTTLHTHCHVTNTNAGKPFPYPSPEPTRGGVLRGGPGGGYRGGSRGVIPLIWAAAVHCPATHHWVVKLFPYSSHCITPTPPRNSHATSHYLPPRTWRTSRGVARTWRRSTSLGFSTTLHTLHCTHYIIT